MTFAECSTSAKHTRWLKWNSFGAMLYEMLTGRRAFHGETAVETLNAILKEDPPEPDAAQRIAPALDRVVR
jgi:eukaryotic-like serine/threonine-protein kinase